MQEEPGGPEAAWRAQRAGWDRLAERMPDLYPAASTQAYRRLEMALIRRSLGPLAGRRLLKLDLWNEAFNTRILPWMRSEGAAAFGLDASGSIVGRAAARARAAGDGLRLLQADARRLPFADESFDCCYSMGTLEHFAEMPEALGEIRRVLRVGGRAVLGVPYRWDPWLRPLLVRLLSACGWYPYAPERSFGVGPFRRLVEGAGLAVTERTGILLMPGLLRMADLYFQVSGSRLRHLTGRLVRPFEWLETRCPWAGRLGYLMVLVVERRADRVRRRP